MNLLAMADRYEVLGQMQDRLLAFKLISRDRVLLQTVTPERIEARIRGASLVQFQKVTLRVRPDQVVEPSCTCRVRDPRDAEAWCGHCLAALKLGAEQLAREARTPPTPPGPTKTTATGHTPPATGHTPPATGSVNPPAPTRPAPVSEPFQLTPPPSAPRPGPVGPPPQTPFTTLQSLFRPWLERPALERWARDGQVDNWLDLPIERLTTVKGVLLPHRFAQPQVARLTVAEALTLPQPRAASVGLKTQELTLLQQALVKELEQARQSTRLGLAEEEAWLARLRPPTLPHLQPVWTRLWALRTTLRQGARPWPGRRTHFHPLVLDLEQGLVRMETRVHALCGGQHAPTIEVRLGNATTPAAVTCSCLQARPGGCSTRLGGLDQVLDWLIRAGTEANVRQFLAVAELAPWQRALQRLDRVLQPPARPAGDPPQEEGELGWRVELEEHLLTPLLVRPRKTGRGLVVRRLTYDHPLLRDEAGLLRQDRALLELIRVRDHHTGHLWWSAAALELALERLQGHPRVFTDTTGSPRPLTIRVLRAELAVQPRPADGALELAVACGDQRWPLAEARRSLLPDPETLRRVLVQPPHLDLIAFPPLLFELLRTVGSNLEPIPAAAALELLQRLSTCAERLPLQIPPELLGEAEPGADHLIVRLVAQPAGGDLLLEVRFLVRPLPDGSVFVPGEGPQLLFRSASADDQQLRHCRRDPARELDQARDLAAALDLTPPPPLSWLLTEPRDALGVLERLEGLQAGAAAATAVDADAPAATAPPRCEVEWSGTRRLRLTRPATPRDLQVSVRQQQDWFGLGGALEVDGHRPSLAELLQAVRDQQRYIRVEGDLWVRIGDQLRQQLQPLAEATAAAGGRGAEVSRFAAPAVQALAEAGAQVDGPRAWLELAARMREAGTLEAPLPAGFRGELRPYQLEGFRWLMRLAHWGAGACLADDMGLGKTIQALAVLLARAGRGPALVVAPTAVGFNWLREAARFAPTLQLRHFSGRSQLGQLEALRPGVVVVTSYDLVHRHTEPLAATRWATLLLDEVQAIKNSATRRARAVGCLQADFRAALTGTPVENRTSELWSVFQAIAPGLLGSAEGFRSRFGLPIERHRDVRAREQLARLVRPFILRRLKEQVAPELPPRTDSRLDVVLSGAERRLYDQLRQAALDELLAQTGPPEQRRFAILAALTRLRQLACHPRLLDPASPIPSAKLAALRELMAELVAEGHRALIFSQFTSHLALVRDALTEDGLRLRYLDGSTPAAQRRVEIDAFQRGEADAFLLSLKAGGTGINLTAADYVIHLDPWWNPAVEDQATDRAHRIGQDRPVTVYRLVARDTIEEGILALHAEKRELVSALLDGTGSAAALRPEELLALITESGRWSGDAEEEGEG